MARQDDIYTRSKQAYEERKKKRQEEEKTTVSDDLFDRSRQAYVDRRNAREANRRDYLAREEALTQPAATVQTPEPTGFNRYFGRGNLLQQSVQQAKASTPNAQMDAAFEDYRRMMKFYDEMEASARRNRDQDLMNYARGRAYEAYTGAQGEYNKYYDAKSGGWLRSSGTLEGLQKQSEQADREELYANLFGNDEQKRYATGRAQNARDIYNRDLQKNHPAEYYARTMSATDIMAKRGAIADRLAELGGVYTRDKGWVMGENQWGEYYDQSAIDAKAEEFNSLKEQYDVYDAAYGRASARDDLSALQRLTEKAKTGDVNAKAQKGREIYTKQGDISFEGDGLINTVLDFIPTASQAAERTANTAFGGDNAKPKWMSDGEAMIYYSLLSESADEANEYKRIVQAKHQSEEYARLEDWSSQNLGTGALGWAGSIPLNLASGLSPYTEGGQALNLYGQALRSGNAKYLNDVLSFSDDAALFAGKGLGDVANLGASVIESWILAQVAGGVGKAMSAAGATEAQIASAVKATSFAGTMVLGGSAAAADYRECLQRGMSDSQAKTHSVLAGLNEAAFEHISLDKLIEVGSVAEIAAKSATRKEFFKGMLKAWAVQAGIEASEEGFTTMANRCADLLQAEFTHGKSQYQERVLEYIAQGMDSVEARKKVDREYATEIMYDVVGGFLSGGLGAGTQYVGPSISLASGAIRDAKLGQLGQVAQQDRNAQWGMQAAEKLGKAGYNYRTSGQEIAETVRKAEGGEAALTQYAKDNSIKDRGAKAFARTATEAVNHMADAMATENSLEKAQSGYNEIVEKYGEGIKPAAQQALTKAVERIATRTSGNVSETVRGFQKTVQAVADPEVQSALQKGLDRAVMRQALSSRGEASERAAARDYFRQRGGAALNLEASVTDEDGRSRTVSIRDMSEDGKKVVLSDGQTVAPGKLSEMGFDAATADVVGMLSRFGVGEDAGKILRAVSANAEGDVYDWAMEYATAWDYGRQGLIKAAEAARRSKLDADTVWEAYEMGKAARERVPQKQRAEIEKAEAEGADSSTSPRSAQTPERSGGVQSNDKGENAGEKMTAKRKGVTGRKGTVTAGESVDLSTLSRKKKQEVEIIRKLASLCGVDIVLEASTVGTDAEGRRIYVGAHGWYENGVIHLDINAGKNFVGDAVGSLLATTGHELTHFMQHYAPEHYARYKAAVLNAIVEMEGEETLERLISEEQKKSTREGGLRKAAAEDEVVADASQKRLGDRAFWEAVAEGTGKQTTMQKVANWLRDWFAKIRQAITGFDKYEEAAGIIDKAEQSVREALGKLYTEGVAEAVRTHDRVGDIKNTATEGGVQFLAREVNGKKIAWVENCGLSSSQLNDHNAVAGYISAHIGDFFTLLESGQKVYIGPELPTEYTQSKYTKHLLAHQKGLVKVKNKAVSALGEMIEIATNRRWEATKHQKTKDAKYGIYKYDSSFAFPVKDQTGKTIRVKAYDVELVIRNASDGKKYLYDVVDIKENTANAIDLTKTETRKGSYAASQSSISVNSISQPTPNSNTQKKNNSSDPHQDRSYEQGSDLDLMAETAEALTEAGGEEYWEALLESAPELAEDRGELKGLMKDYRAQARKLAAAEERLAEAKRQLTTTNRKLNTRGIATLAQDIMKALGAGDAKNRGVAKQVTAILTETYQAALDALDNGSEASEVNEIVYRGAVKAAELLGKEATHSEKYGHAWTTTSLERYYGEEGADALRDTVVSFVYNDFAVNRYRPGIQPTAADRITERVEARMQKQVDAAAERAQTAEKANEKLQRDLDFYKSAGENAAAASTNLSERLQEARAELKESAKLSEAERRAKQKRIDSLQAQLKTKRQEAQAWKNLAERNESLLRAALKSKNADLDALRVQLDRNASEAQKKQAALVRQLEQQAQREQDILAGKLKPPAMQRLLKAERERAAEKMAAHKDEIFAAQKDRKKATALRSRIRNLSKDIKRSMTSPTDRNYLPLGLAEHMAELLDTMEAYLLDTTRSGEKYQDTAEALRNLADAYYSLQDEDVDFTYRTEYDDEIWHAIKDIQLVFKEAAKAAGEYDAAGFTARDLNTEQLQKVYDLMKSIRDSMRNAAKLLNSEQWASVYEAIESIVGQQQSMTPIADAGKAEARKRRRLLDNLSPMRAVEMMANWDRDAALYQLFQAVEQGGVDEMSWIMGYNKSLQALKTGKNEKSYREALTKLHDYGARDKNSGKAVQMTQMQAIQLYMTWQREQANDKLVHLQKGGATIRDALAVMDGKGSKAASHTVEVTPELIGNIEQSLSAWDRAYMEEIRRYLTKEARETNKVLYQLKHRVLTTEAAYVPYVVDKGYLESKLEGSDVFNLFVKTPGSTNALQKRAPQPVIIDGMDTLMNRHVQEQARYIGLAVPIRDFAKVFNGRLADPDGGVYTSLKKTIEDNFGEGGTHLILQALLDAQGGSKGNSWSSHIAETLNKLQGSFVKAALLVNPSVTIKQAASYVAAESVLSHRALTAGNRAFAAKGDQSHSPGLIAQLFAAPEGRTARRLYEEIDAHTSMHYQRRMGMSYTELANEAQRSGKLRRTMNAVGAQMEQSAAGHKLRKAGEMLNPAQWIQRMDVATTAALWVAAKEQARMDGLRVGSEEYWQHTTELYERCLRETQPMYDGLHRNSHQKQGGGLMQYLFPFRTVPIQNHGQIASAFEALRASKNKSKAKQAEARRFFAKTVWAQTESAAVFAFMTFLAAVLKRKTKKYRDDETEELTAGSLLKGLGLDAASTLFSVAFPMWGSEAWSAGDRAVSKLTGKSGYSFDAFTVGAVDLLNDLISSGDKLFADAGKLMRGEDVTLSDVGDHAQAMLLKAAKIAGIPADTIKTYVAGTIGNIEDIAAGRIPALNDESWDRSAAVNARRYLKAWIAGDPDKVDAVEAEMLEDYAAAGKNDEEAAKALKAKLTGEAKNAWTDGSLDEEDAIDFLTETGFYTEDEAWKKLMEWENKQDHDGEEDYNYSEYDDLREALTAGKSLDEAAKDYLEHGYTEKQVRDAAVKHLRQRYADGELSEEETAELLKDYQRKKENGEYREITDDEAYFTIREWEANEAHEGDEEYSYKKYETVYQTIDANGDLAPVIRELGAHGVSEKQIRSEAKSYLMEKYEAGSWDERAFKNLLSRYCKITKQDEVAKIVNNANCRKDSGYHLGDLNEAYLDGELSAEKTRQMLVRYGGKSWAEANNRLRWLDLKKKDPELEISEELSNAWHDGTSTSRQNGHRSAKAAGMTVQQYIQAKQILTAVTGTDKDGDGRTDTGTKETAYIEAISRMNLTPAQKDALYYEVYKGTSKTARKKW